MQNDDVAGDEQGNDEWVGSLRIHVAKPQAPSSAGVLLLPTIFGLNTTMKQLAGQLVAFGVTAVVWDPYNGGAGSDDLTEVPAMLAKSKHCEDRQVVADLKVIVDHMTDELGLGAIGSIGWCFGARIGLLHAGTDERIRVLSAYNPTIWADTAAASPRSRADFPGQTLDEFELAAAIRAPVQVSRPEHDLTEPAQYERLLSQLWGRQSPTFYEYYPSAEHGFSYTPGAANEVAHRYAWAATLTLFDLELRGR